VRARGVIVAVGVFRDGVCRRFGRDNDGDDVDIVVVVDAVVDFDLDFDSAKVDNDADSGEKSVVNDGVVQGVEYGVNRCDAATDELVSDETMTTLRATTENRTVATQTDDNVAASTTATTAAATLPESGVNATARASSHSSEGSATANAASVNTRDATSKARNATRRNVRHEATAMSTVCTLRSFVSASSNMATSC
jgi:hypothetical protein